MAWWRSLSQGLRVLTNRTAADRDVADEVAHYLDEATAQLQASGVPPDEARRQARRELGSLTAVRDEVRGQGWEHAVDTFVADLRYGGRRLRRSPGFAGVAALTLALGLGASTAIFSAVNPVLFQPLPYPDAERLMMVWDGENGIRNDVTFGTYRELLERSRSFASLAVTKPLQATLTGVAEPERLDGQFVSAGYFALLGVRPALGRDFHAADDLPNRPFVVVISDALWRRRFGANPAIIGRTLALDGTAMTVIGIMPAGFENVLSPSADIWSPLQYDPTLPANGREWGHHLRLVGRLTDGVDAATGRRELVEIAAGPVAGFPRPPWAQLGNGFIAVPLQDELTRAVRPALLAVLGAVVLLLTIACVNVTNLLLARGAGRRQEMAVRTALGASRSRLVRQLLAEAMLLAAAAGVLGIGAAYAAVDLIVGLAPAALPRAGAISVNSQALVFTLALSTVVGLVVGVVPALQGSRSAGRVPPVRPSARITGGQQLTRRALVVVQVAIALVLLVGAGLLIRSLQQLFAIPPGFDSTNLLTMQVQAAGLQFRDADTTHRFFTQALAAVRQVPGVATAAFSSQLPLTGDEDLWGVRFEADTNATAAPEDSRGGLRHAVSPGYLEAMGIPLRAGRTLDGRDTAGSPPVVIINESFARRRLPGMNPIGQRLRIGPGPWSTVVGVVADVTHASLAVRPADAVYVTAAQWTQFADRARWLIVRAHPGAGALTPAIRDAIRSVDRDHSLLRAATMDERLRASAADRRFALVLFEAFGVTALLLAAIGTYSLLSGSVAERTREMGLRAALGASRPELLLLVVRQGLTLAGLGIVLGVGAAALASGALGALLFGVSRLDTVTYAGVIALLALVSIIACWMPALRAARVHPAVALLSE